MLLLGLAAIFLAIALLLSTTGAITAERQQVHRSLAAVQALQTSTAQPQLRQELARPFGERVVGPTMVRLTSIGRHLTPTGQIARIRHSLELAGNPPDWDVDRIVAFKVLG